MRALLESAWLGWERYTGNHKLTALLLAALLFFWFGGMGRRARDAVGKMAFYTSLMTAACVCPISAAFLMLYQTRFYSYEWIWSLVPATAMTAACGAVFLGRIWENYSCFSVKGLLRACLPTLALVLLVFLGGSLGQENWGGEVTERDRERIGETLRELEQEGQEICLWAPREVMACARAYSGEIRLLYGRDMWDSALGSYSYEVYDGTRQELYQWMTQAEESGRLEGTMEVLTVDETGEQHSSEKRLDGMACIQDALELGANYILLPGNMEAEELEKLQASLAVELRELGEYVLLRPLS